MRSTTTTPASSGRADVLRDLHVVDEPLYTGEFLAARQHVGDDVERGIAGLEMTRREPGQEQPRQLDAIGDRFLLHAGRARRRES